MPTPSLRIFISSTSVDLQEHRQAVFDRIIQSGEFGIDMKHFGSRPEDPVTVCREAIDEADVLVGIYAWRYGWVPDGETKSITEMEFDYARERGIPCLCYVVKKNHPWNPEWIEGGSGKEKLEAFKNKVGKLVRTEFTTGDNLAAGVVADLSREKGKPAAARENPAEVKWSWQDVFEKLPLDADNLQLLQTVNCDRHDHFQQQLDDHYGQHRAADQNLVYFISACPLQHPGSLAKRLVYWRNAEDRPEFSRYFETDRNPGQVYLPRLDIKPTPAGTWAGFWSACVRLGLRGENLGLVDFSREKDRFLVPGERIACTFVLKENAWNAAPAAEHLEYLCRELEKMPAGARRFVFFFILEFSRIETDGHEDRHPQCAERIDAVAQLLARLQATAQDTNRYTHISLLPPVKRYDVKGWLEEVLPDARPGQVGGALEKLNQIRSPEEQQGNCYNMERVEDMQYQAYLVAQR